MQPVQSKSVYLEYSKYFVHVMYLLGDAPFMNLFGEWYRDQKLDSPPNTQDDEKDRNVHQPFLCPAHDADSLNWQVASLPSLHRV